VNTNNPGGNKFQKLQSKSISHSEINFIQQRTINEDEKNKIDTKEVVKKMKKKDGKEILASLYGLISMIIISKFNVKKIEDHNYQPWDSVSVKFKKVMTFIDNLEDRKKIIDVSKGIYFKAYPLNVDSSNIDPVKCWLMGIQVAAMNMQSLLDDNLLINNVFFKAFGGLGYVLKPEKLLPESEEYETYESPVGTLKIELLAGFMLHKLFNKEEGADRVLTLNAYIIGHTTDDNQNKKYQTKITSNFLNPYFNNEIYEFDIYEKDVSVVFIKITSGSGIVGRCVVPLCAIAEGYRTIPIYDNQCDQFLDSVLICRVSKTF
jgi:hypothetical protein